MRLHEQDDHHLDGDLDYEALLTHQRQDKDAYFRDSHESPIPEAERAQFGGLSYYAVDPGYRFASLALEPLDAGETPEAMIQTSDGQLRPGRRVGTFAFDIDGTDTHLTALQLTETQNQVLFVPFRDATSGAETYVGGRYLDLAPLDDGRYDLDFITAYAPFCAYSPHYSCPLPPPENHLAVRIAAGERLA